VAQEKKFCRSKWPGAMRTALLAWVLFVPDPARAHNLPKTWISVGPQLSYNFASNGRKAAGYGVDFAYALVPLWGGGGFKLSHGDDVIVSPYVEAGVWLLVNAGVGYALSFHGGETDHNIHLFIGEPIPLNWLHEDLSGETWLLMVEPYYRRTWRLGSDFRENELGILMKFVFDL
jgi:hypothetical protein